VVVWGGGKVWGSSLVSVSLFGHLFCSGVGFVESGALVAFALGFVLVSWPCGDSAGCEELLSHAVVFDGVFVCSCAPFLGLWCFCYGSLFVGGLFWLFLWELGVYLSLIL